MTECDKLATWAVITSFVFEHQGNKRRQFKGSSVDVAAIDLVIFDVPKGLPVLGFIGGRHVPLWNTLALEKKKMALKNLHGLKQLLLLQMSGCVTTEMFWYFILTASLFQGK